MTKSHDEVTAESVTFADDANYIPDATPDEIIDKIKLTITEFQSFCRRLNICMNVSKTFYMSSTGIDYEIVIDGVKIEHKNICNLSYSSACIFISNF